MDRPFLSAPEKMLGEHVAKVKLARYEREDNVEATPGAG
jgi:hypothetical protein